MNPRNAVRNPDTWIVSLLLILSAGLRLYHLGFQSFWNDELASAFYINHSDLSSLFNAIRNDTFPPAYYLLLNFTMRLLGNSEFALRLPSAISGILEIGVMYFLGRQIFSWKEGMISALLMTVLWAPIFYSQEARVYSLFLLFTTLSFYFWVLFVRQLNGGEKYKLSAALYILSSGCLLYLHYFGFFVVLIEAASGVLYSIFNAPRLDTASNIVLIKTLPIFAVFGALILIFLPWLPNMLFQYSNQYGFIYWIPRPRPTEFFNFLLYFVFIPSIKFVIFAGIVILFGLCMTIYLKYKNRLTSDQLWMTFILLALLIIPFLIVYLFSILVKPMLTYRYFIFVLPAAYLLFARGLALLPVNRIVLVLFSVVITIYLLYALVINSRYYTVPIKEQYREAIYYMTKQVTFNENAVLIACVPDRYFVDYYLTRFNNAKRVDLIACRQDDLDNLIKLIDQSSANDFFEINSDIKTPDPQILNVLSSHLHLTEQRDFLGIHTRIYVR